MFDKKILWILPSVAEYRRHIIQNSITIANIENYKSIVLTAYKDKKRHVKSISDLNQGKLIRFYYINFAGIEFYFGLLIRYFIHVLNTKYIIINPRRGSVQHILICIFSKLINIKVILWGNNYKRDRHKSKIKNNLYNFIEFLFQFSAYKVFGYSPDKKNYKYAKEKFEPGINISSFILLNDFGDLNPEKTKKYRLVYWGGIKDGKGLEQLCESIQKINKLDFNLSIDIFGDGPKLDAYIKKFESPFINFMGSLHLKKNLNFVKKYDAFILPGQGGLAPLDAVALGLPCITSNGDGTLWHLIDKYKIGIKVKDDNSEYIKATITNFYYNHNVIHKDFKFFRPIFLEACRKKNIVSLLKKELQN